MPKVVLFCVLLTANLTWAAQVPPLALDFAQPGQNFTNGSWSLGWEFNVLQPYTVTALGFYDDLKNGLTQAHDVGIYNAAGALLVWTTVVPADPLISWWRWQEITPYTLPIGSGYRIAGVSLTENYTWNTTGLVVDPRIQYLASAWTVSNVLVFPANTDGMIGYFGPNMMTIPEPACLGWLGLLALAAYKRLRS
jgi:hypothetical protein